MNDQKTSRPRVVTPYPPKGPPGHEFTTLWLGGTQETPESKKRNRDYDMFMRGYNYALTGLNVPQPGDYV
jgi:hypothetical protein